jgi:hypothetical protein
MHAYTSGKVPPTPAVSISSKTLIFSFGLNAFRKLVTASIRTCKGSIYSLYAFELRRLSDVTPQCKVVLVRIAACERRSLCPRCRWSNVPPKQTTSYLNKCSLVKVACSCTIVNRSPRTLTSNLVPSTGSCSG